MVLSCRSAFVLRAGELFWMGVQGEFFRSLRYPTQLLDRDGILRRARDPAEIAALGSGTASRSPPGLRKLI